MITDSRGGGFDLAWSRISIHCPASSWSKVEINFRPSLDDRISAKDRMNSVSFGAARAFSHNLVKSIYIAISRWGGRDRRKGGDCGSGPGLEIPPQLAVASRSNVETLEGCALEAAPEITETSVLAGNFKWMGRRWI